MTARGFTIATTDGFLPFTGYRIYDGEALLGAVWHEPKGWRYCRKFGPGSETRYSTRDVAIAALADAARSR